MPFQRGMAVCQITSSLLGLDYFQSKYLEENMITQAVRIQQPISGMFQEKIYDIESSWNSDKWTWIKFTEDADYWCGEFRGEYRGIGYSASLGICVVLTSDYLYIIDNYTHQMIYFEQHPQYIDLISTPEGDIFITDDYSIEKFVDNSINNIEIVVMPLNADYIRFKGLDGNAIRITCYEFLRWGEELELWYDYKNNEWMN